MKKIHQKASILLVEDDENLGFLVQDNLENEGYTVQLCADGLTGLQVFAQQTFDLCILDVMLPVLDGFTLAQEIRKKKIPSSVVSDKDLFQAILSLLQGKAEFSKNVTN